jgi:hypothetical protein
VGVKTVREFLFVGGQPRIHNLQHILLEDRTNTSTPSVICLITESPSEGNKGSSR